MIELVFSPDMITKLRSPAIECKEGLCISRLVDFELLLELKLEQKTFTPLVKLVLSHRKSGLRIERLSVPMIYFRYCAGSTRTSPLPEDEHNPKSVQNGHNR
jgi:hypothetical protein